MGAPHVPHGRPIRPDRPDLCDHSVRGRARNTLHDDPLATMMGLHIRVGLEDTPWEYPTATTRRDNLQMFGIGPVHRGASIGLGPHRDEYRRLIGKPSRA